MIEGRYLSPIYFHVNVSYPWYSMILVTTNNPNTSCAASEAFPAHRGTVGMSNVALGILWQILGIGSISRMQDNRHLNHTSIPWVMLSASLLYTHHQLVAKLYLPPKKSLKADPAGLSRSHCHGLLLEYFNSLLTKLLNFPFVIFYSTTL